MSLNALTTRLNTLKWLTSVSLQLQVFYMPFFSQVFSTFSPRLRPCSNPFSDDNLTILPLIWGTWPVCKKKSGKIKKNGNTMYFRLRYTCQCKKGCCCTSGLTLQEWSAVFYGKKRTINSRNISFIGNGGTRHRNNWVHVYERLCFFFFYHCRLESFARIASIIQIARNRLRKGLW